VDDNWIERQRSYQEGTYGFDYRRMWLDGSIVPYVASMLTAAQIEIAEAFQEVPWKPWTQLTDEQRTERLSENLMKVGGELVDVLFFVGNIFAGLGISDEQLREMYAAKMGVNKQRQVDGYDGISTKCARCKRALDEPNAAPAVERNGARYCGFICAVEDQGETPELVTI